MYLLGSSRDRGDSVMIEEPETDCHWVSDASDWSSIKSGEIWNLRLCLEKCQSEEVYDQAASAAGSNGNDGNYGISCLLRGDSSILQRSRLGTRKSSWHWGWGRSNSVTFLIRTSGREYHSQAGPTRGGEVQMRRQQLSYNWQALKGYFCAVPNFWT